MQRERTLFSGQQSLAGHPLGSNNACAPSRARVSRPALSSPTADTQRVRVSLSKRTWLSRYRDNDRFVQTDLSPNQKNKKKVGAGMDLSISSRVHGSIFGKRVLCCRRERRRDARNEGVHGASPWAVHSDSSFCSSVIFPQPANVHASFHHRLSGPVFSPSSACPSSLSLSFFLSALSSFFFFDSTSSSPTLLPNPSYSPQVHPPWTASPPC